MFLVCLPEWQVTPRVTSGAFSQISVIQDRLLPMPQQCVVDMLQSLTGQSVSQYKQVQPSTGMNAADQLHHTNHIYLTSCFISSVGVQVTKQILGQSVSWYYPEYALTNDVLNHLHLTLLIKYSTQTIYIWQIRVLAYNCLIWCRICLTNCTEVDTKYWQYQLF